MLQKNIKKAFFIFTCVLLLFGGLNFLNTPSTLAYTTDCADSKDSKLTVCTLTPNNIRDRRIKLDIVFNKSDGKFVGIKNCAVNDGSVGAVNCAGVALLDTNTTTPLRQDKLNELVASAYDGNIVSPGNFLVDSIPGNPGMIIFGIRQNIDFRGEPDNMVIQGPFGSYVTFAKSTSPDSGYSKLKNYVNQCLNNNVCSSDGGISDLIHSNRGVLNQVPLGNLCGPALGKCETPTNGYSLDEYNKLNYDLVDKYKATVSKGVSCFNYLNRSSNKIAYKCKNFSPNSTGEVPKVNFQGIVIDPCTNDDGLFYFENGKATCLAAPEATAVANGNTKVNVVQTGAAADGSVLGGALNLLMGIITAIVLALAWIVGFVVSFLLYFVMTIFLYLLRMDPLSNGMYDAARDVWKYFIGLANAFVLGSMIYFGVGYILNIENIKKDLKDIFTFIVVFALIENLSFFLVALVIELGQSFGNFFFYLYLIAAYGPSALGTDKANEFFIKGFSEAIGKVSVIRCAQGCQINSTDPSQAYGKIMSILGDVLGGKIGISIVALGSEIMYIVIVAVAITAFFKGLRMALYRLVILWVLLITSPILLAAFMAPIDKAKKTAQKAIKLLITYSIFYPVVIFILILVNLFTLNTSKYFIDPALKTAGGANISTPEGIRSIMEALVLLLIGGAIPTAMLLLSFNFIDKELDGFVKAGIDMAKSGANNLKSAASTGWKATKVVAKTAGAPVAFVGKRIGETKWAERINDNLIKRTKSQNGWNRALGHTAKFAGGGIGNVLTGKWTDAAEDYGGVLKNFVWDNQVKRRKSEREVDKAERTTSAVIAARRLHLTGLAAMDYDRSDPLAGVSSEDVNAMIRTDRNRVVGKDANGKDIRAPDAGDLPGTIIGEAKLDASSKIDEAKAPRFRTAANNAFLERIKTNKSKFENLSGDEQVKFIQMLNQRANDGSFRAQLYNNESARAIATKLVDDKLLDDDALRAFKQNLPAMRGSKADIARGGINAANGIATADSANFTDPTFLEAYVDTASRLDDPLYLSRSVDKLIEAFVDNKQPIEQTRQAVNKILGIRNLGTGAQARSGDQVVNERYGIAGIPTASPQASIGSVPTGASLGIGFNAPGSSTGSRGSSSSTSSRSGGSSGSSSGPTATPLSSAVPTWQNVFGGSTSTSSVPTRPTGSGYGRNTLAAPRSFEGAMSQIEQFTTGGEAEKIINGYSQQNPYVSNQPKIQQILEQARQNTDNTWTSSRILNELKKVGFTFDDNSLSASEQVSNFKTVNQNSIDTHQEEAEKLRQIHKAETEATGLEMAADVWRTVANGEKSATHEDNIPRLGIANLAQNPQEFLNELKRSEIADPKDPNNQDKRLKGQEAFDTVQDPEKKAEITKIFASAIYDTENQKAKDLDAKTYKKEVAVIKSKLEKKLEQYVDPNQKVNVKRYLAAQLENYAANGNNSQLKSFVSAKGEEEVAKFDYDLRSNGFEINDIAGIEATANTRVKKLTEQANTIREKPFNPNISTGEVFAGVPTNSNTTSTPPNSAPKLKSPEQRISDNTELAGIERFKARLNEKISEKIEKITDTNNHIRDLAIASLLEDKSDLMQNMEQSVVSGVDEAQKAKINLELINTLVNIEDIRKQYGSDVGTFKTIVEHQVDTFQKQTGTSGTEIGQYLANELNKYAMNQNSTILDTVNLSIATTGANINQQEVAKLSDPKYHFMEPEEAKRQISQDIISEKAASLQLEAVSTHKKADALLNSNNDAIHGYVKALEKLALESLSSASNLQASDQKNINSQLGTARLASMASKDKLAGVLKSADDKYADLELTPEQAIELVHSLHLISSAPAEKRNIVINQETNRLKSILPPDSDELLRDLANFGQEGSSILQKILVNEGQAAYKTIEIAATDSNKSIQETAAQINSTIK